MAQEDYSDLLYKPKSVEPQDDYSDLLYKPKSKKSSHSVQSTPEVIAKSAASGVASLFDIPQNVATLTEKYVLHPEHNIGGQARRGINYLLGRKHIPLTQEDSLGGNIRKGFDYITGRKHVPLPEKGYFESLEPEIASRGIKRGIKQLTGTDITPRPSTATQRVISHGADFGAVLGATAATGGVGGLGKLKYLNKLKQVGKSAGHGAVAGVASGGLQEAGVNPLVADLAGIATPGFGKAIGRGLQDKTVGRTIAGLSRKALKKDVAKAAQDLGIDLPATALTNSRVASFLNESISKLPYYGDKIIEARLKTQDQFSNVMNNIYKKVGPERTLETEGMYKELYNSSKAKAREAQSFVPNKTLEVLGKPLTTAASPSPDQKKVMKILEDLKKSYSAAETVPEILTDKKTGLQIFKNEKGQYELYAPNKKLPMIKEETSVRPQQIIDQKVALNEIINWDTPKSIKDHLKVVQRALLDDLAVVGEGTAWYGDLKKADALFGKIAQREKLEKLIGHKATNFANDKISYNALAKAIKEPEKRRVLQKSVSPEIFEEIDQLGTVSQGLSQASGNILNPSGTSYVAAAIAFLGGMVTSPAKTLATVGAIHYGHKLVADKKFIDQAVKLALDLEKNPNSVKNAIGIKALNDRAKKLTGYGVISLKEFKKELNNKKEE